MNSWYITFKNSLLQEHSELHLVKIKVKLTTIITATGQIDVKKFTVIYQPLTEDIRHRSFVIVRKVWARFNKCKYIFYCLV